MRTLIACEGIDDIRAIRGILDREFGAVPAPGQSERFRGSQIRRMPTGRVVELVNGRDRRRAALEAARVIEESDGLEIDRVGLVFDPDLDSEGAWQSWVNTEVLRAFDATLSGRLVDQASVAAGVLFVAVPWDLGPAERNLDPRWRGLERFAVHVLGEGRAADGALVERLLGLLRADSRSLEGSGGWKTAFRLFNAVVAPETEDGFVDRAFGQDASVRASLVELLAETSFRDRLSRLVL